MFRIASLYPIAQLIERPHFKPQSLWMLPACDKRGEPVYLDVVDQNQTDYVGLQRHIDVVIPAREIVNDLYQAFALGIPGADQHAGPAIWIPDNGIEATPEEIAVQQARQDRYFQLKVKEARYFHQRQMYSSIVKVHHVASAELGISGEDWMVEQSIAARVACPFCSVFINANVAKCPNCKEIVNQQLYDQVRSRMATGAVVDTSELTAEELERLSLDRLDDVTRADAATAGEGLDPRVRAAVAKRSGRAA